MQQINYMATDVDKTSDTTANKGRNRVRLQKERVCDACMCVLCVFGDREKWQKYSETRRESYFPRNKIFKEKVSWGWGRRGERKSGKGVE